MEEDWKQMDLSNYRILTIRAMLNVPFCYKIVMWSFLNMTP